MHKIFWALRGIAFNVNSLQAKIWNIKCLSILYYLYYWCPNNQTKCADVLVLLVLPKTDLVQTKWACMLTVTCDLQYRHREEGILLCERQTLLLLLRWEITGDAITESGLNILWWFLFLICTKQMQVMIGMKYVCGHNPRAVSQIVALYVLPAFRISSACLMSAFLAHSTSFSNNFLQT